MLTFFTSCKPFKGEDAVAQRNAISSWKMLRPEPEIMVFGDEEGVAELAGELGLRHIPEVRRSEWGNPLVSDLFEQAQKISNHDICCYINADIILLSDFPVAIKLAAEQKNQFLLIGKRYDLDVKERLIFDTEWEEKIAQRVRSEGQLYHLPGMDYFVFRKGQWGRVLPFALGNIRWDNWMVYEARRTKITTIDATSMITAIHQNHEMKHAEQGDGRGIEDDPAAVYNLQLYGQNMTSFFHLDASHVLGSNGLKLALSRAYLGRRLVTTPVFYPKTSGLCRLLSWLAGKVTSTLTPQ
jgi:hypothetical protein